MNSIACFLSFAAFVMAIVNAGWGKPPIWVAVLLLSIVQLLGCIPLR